MADKDFSKHVKFIEAAISNPKHPVYQLGMHRSPVLQHYAVNVATLKVIEGEQWFKEYPEYAAKIEQVMALCEAEETPATEPDEVAALKAENEQLKAKVTGLEKPPAAPTEETPEA